MSRRAHRQTTADQVRTGDTIFTDWSPSGLTLTVDYLTRDLFANPEGATLDRIRFTGTDSIGRHVHESWGVGAKGRVYVVMEAPLKGDVAGSGVFGALDADEPVPNLSDLALCDIDGWELL